MACRSHLTRDTVTELLEGGSCYTARHTRNFAHDIELILRTMLVSSPQSNGMAKAFVRTLKRDDARVNSKPDAQTVIEQQPSLPGTKTTCIRTEFWAIDHLAGTSQTGEALSGL